MQLLNLLLGVSSASFGYLALGSGTAAPQPTDVALVAENAASRVAFTGKTITGGIAVIRVYFAPDKGNGNIREWGLFTAASEGVMLNRGLTAMTKTDTEEMIVTVTLDVTPS